MKKFLALLLAAMCCMSLCVIAVSAEETDPFEGMEVMSYEEYVAAELELVALAAADVISVSVEYDENETEEDRFDSF
jgi:hypothetical protein